MSCFPLSLSTEEGVSVPWVGWQEEDSDTIGKLWHIWTILTICITQCLRKTNAVLPLFPQTCCTESFLWSYFCPTRAVRLAAFSPRHPPGWTWGFAPGCRGGWYFESHSRWNAAQPRNLKSSIVVFTGETWWVCSAVSLAYIGWDCHAGYGFSRTINT